MDNFDKVCIETIREFKNEYGEKKFKEIENKIFNSRSVKNNMSRLENSKTGISSSLVLAAVSSVGFFAFSNKRYTAMGCLLFIVIWNQICNINNCIFSDSKMISVLEGCFEKSKELLW